MEPDSFGHFETSMKLITKLTIVMVGSVILTAATVSSITYFRLDRELLPVELASLDASTDLLAKDFAAYIGSARAALLAEYYSSEIRDFSVAETDEERNSVLRDLERDFTACLTAWPQIAKFRLFDARNNGYELLRVDRMGEHNSIRVVPRGELQFKGERGFFQEVLHEPEGSVYVSAIDLNQEFGEIEVPHVPMLRLGMNIFDRNHELIAVLLINLDMRPQFERLRRSGVPSDERFVINPSGDFLMHRNRDKEFGFDLGRRHTIAEQNPEFAELLSRPMVDTADAIQTGGKLKGLSVAPVMISGVHVASIVQLHSEERLIITAESIRRSSQLGTGIAVVCAMIAALLLTRSQIGPLRRLLIAVKSDDMAECLRVGESLPEDIKVLATALEVRETALRDHIDKLDREVMERVKAQGELEDALSHLNAIFENIPVSLWTFDLSGRVRVSYGKMSTTREGQEAISAHAYYSDNVEFKELVDKAFSGQTAVATLREKESVCTFNLSPIREDGVIKGIIGVAVDISEQALLEDQLRQAQKMESIGRLAGGIAHDFNNMLTVIQCTGELLEEDFGSQPTAVADIRTIIDTAQNAAQLTRQLLAFSRKQMLQPQILNLNQHVSQSEKMLRRLIGEDIDLVTSLSPELNNVLLDPTQVEQIILNLAVNARDAMPNGGILSIETSNIDLDEAYVTTHKDISVGPHVMLAVSDNGTGMDSHVLENLFEPFFTTKEKGKGTGLGLATVHGIVKQSGGSIYVYSEVGKGTSFKLFFPITNETKRTASSEVAKYARRGTETILYVEDQDKVRAAGCAFLRRHGYIVIEAENGPQAIELSRSFKEKIDLLLTDMIMPKMSGAELADIIRKEREGIAVIHASGYSDELFIRQGMLDSGTTFLAKPFSQQSLIDSVRNALAKASPSKSGSANETSDTAG